MSKFKAITFATKVGKEILSRARDVKITTWLGTGLALGVGVGTLNAAFSIIAYKQQLSFNGQFEEYQKDITNRLGKDQPDIEGKLEAYQKDIKGILAGYQTTVESKFDGYQSDIKAKLAEYQPNVENRLGQHQSDIQTKLSEYQPNIDAKLAEHQKGIKDILDDYRTDVKSKFGAYQSGVQDKLGELQSYIEDKLGEHGANITGTILANKDEIIKNNLDIAKTSWSRLAGIVDVVASNKKDLETFISGIKEEILDGQEDAKVELIQDYLEVSTAFWEDYSERFDAIDNAMFDVINNVIEPNGSEQRLLKEMRKGFRKVKDRQNYHLDVLRADIYDFYLKALEVIDGENAG